MYTLFADIASGETDVADILFLAAFIVFVVGAVVSWFVTPRALVQTLVCIGLALLSIAWMIL